MKKGIAAEMLRVLEPDGVILWYDYYMNNPKNPDVKGVKKRNSRTLPALSNYPETHHPRPANNKAHSS
ncbi:MAG: hypothetical protein IT451_00360 [Candidatus Brocadia sp.]|nr:hypothetical protein [Candidatus Brocadia sp.]